MPNSSVWKRGPVYLNSYGWVKLHQLRKLLRRQATAEDSLGLRLQLNQNLLLLSWQQRPFQGLLEQPLKNAGLVCFPIAAETVIPQQVKRQRWMYPLHFTCTWNPACLHMSCFATQAHCSRVGKANPGPCSCCIQLLIASTAAPWHGSGTCSASTLLVQSTCCNMTCLTLQG